MNKGVLAIKEDGTISFCTAPLNKRGKGRCDHIMHQELGESQNDFLAKANEFILNNLNKDQENQNIPSNENKKSELLNEDMSDIDEFMEDELNEEFDEISQEEIDNYANQIDSIAGCHVTSDNLFDVLYNLHPEQVRQIVKIGFDAAPEFSLPITDENYMQADVENKLFFTNLPEYGIAGKTTAIKQMFDQIGEVPSYDGDVEIKGNYRDGLTPSEYFLKQFSARKAAISKTVSVAKPGFIARKLFYALSDLEIKNDCGSDSSDGILQCKIPGGLCSKCAKKSGLFVEPGTLFGSVVSTNLSEPGTQLIMKEFHTGGKGLKQAHQRELINNTFDAWSNSYIIQNARNAESTEQARRIIFEGLKEQYKTNGIAMDDYNIMIIAKKMTSFKRDKDGTRYVRNGEKCDIMSIGSIGNFYNPFKSSELSSGYKNITKPGEFILSPDAANEIIF